MTFVAGVVIGAVAGVFVMALAVMARTPDPHEEILERLDAYWERRMNETGDALAQRLRDEAGA